MYYSIDFIGEEMVIHFTKDSSEKRNLSLMPEGINMDFAKFALVIWPLLLTSLMFLIRWTS